MAADFEAILNPIAIQLAWPSEAPTLRELWPECNERWRYAKPKIQAILEWLPYRFVIYARHDFLEDMQAAALYRDESGQFLEDLVHLACDKAPASPPA